MEFTTTEREILEPAIAALNRQAGLQLRLRWRLRTGEGGTQEEQHPEFMLEIAGKRFLIDVKKWVPQANTGVLIDRLKSLPIPGLLVADYVNPKMAERFREQGVMFIDTAGNAYINVPPIYTFIKGNRNEDGATKRKEKPLRAFEVTGLKIIHALLCNPGLANAAYREIAQTADVALGTVSRVFQELNAGGYLVYWAGADRGGQGGRRLQQYGKLLQRWLEGFSEKLQPKQWLGRYVADDPDWWERIDIKNYKGYWGGEIAAAGYTEYLKPRTATVYFPERMNNRFLSDTCLRKQFTPADDAGAVVDIYRIFWKGKGREYTGLIDPLTVCAELLATGDAGNVEKAKIIREEYLSEHIRQYG